jgi:hypothetical protein
MLSRYASVLSIPLFLSLASHSQSLLFPTDYMFDVRRQRAVALDTNDIVHTSLQPFIYKEIAPDTLRKLKPGADPFFDKLFYENLIEVRHIDRSSGYPRKFNIDINPILNLYAAKDMLDSAKGRISTNTRGVWLRGAIGKKFLFESAFIENQSYFPVYLKAYATATEIVPGQGRWKNFKSTGFDYAMSSGIIHYQVSKNFWVRLGHGKQKIGNGYRSLLLSDNSFNYPYLQLTASFFKQKLQYSQTYALLMNLTDGGSKIPPGTERIFQKKAASFQHLSWHASKYLDIYFFQGLIASATDSNNAMHLKPYYANPLIFSNIGVYGFNNSNHIIAGSGMEVRPFRKLALYGQFMYDGTSATGDPNYGWQAGIKYYDVLGLKNLFFQYEYNYVSKYSYYSTKYPAQDYSHYNQSLTTPALFQQEHVAILTYNYKRVFIQLKQNYSAGLYTNIRQYSSYFDSRIGYMINPNYNFSIMAGSTLRNYLDETVSSKIQQNQLFYIGLRTSLYNLYYDF